MSNPSFSKIITPENSLDPHFITFNKKIISLYKQAENNELDINSFQYEKLDSLKLKAEINCLSYCNSTFCGYGILAAGLINGSIDLCLYDTFGADQNTNSLPSMSYSLFLAFATSVFLFVPTMINLSLIDTNPIRYNFIFYLLLVFVEKKESINSRKTSKNFISNVINISPELGKICNDISFNPYDPKRAVAGFDVLGNQPSIKIFDILKQISIQNLEGSQEWLLQRLDRLMIYNFSPQFTSLNNNINSKLNNTQHNDLAIELMMFSPNKYHASILPDFISEPYSIKSVKWVPKFLGCIVAGAVLDTSSIRIYDTNSYQNDASITFYEYQKSPKNRLNAIYGIEFNPFNSNQFMAHDRNHTIQIFDLRWPLSSITFSTKPKLGLGIQEAHYCTTKSDTISILGVNSPKIMFWNLNQSNTEFFLSVASKAENISFQEKKGFSQTRNKTIKSDNSTVPAKIISTSFSSIKSSNGKNITSFAPINVGTSNSCILAEQFDQNTNLVLPLKSKLALATIGVLEKNFDNPTIHVVFEYLKTGNWEKSIKNRTTLGLSERLALSFVYLDDNMLLGYIKELYVECCLNGRIEGIVLTGSSNDGQLLLTKYADNTTDIQTAALVSSIWPLREPSSSQNLNNIDLLEISDKWKIEYRHLLMRWEMYNKKCSFDVEVANLRELHGLPRLTPYMEYVVSKSVNVRCAFCKKPVGHSNVKKNSWLLLNKLVQSSDQNYKKNRYIKHTANTRKESNLDQNGSAFNINATSSARIDFDQIIDTDSAIKSTIAAPTAPSLASSLIQVASPIRANTPTQALSTIQASSPILNLNSKQHSRSNSESSKDYNLHSSFNTVLSSHSSTRSSSVSHSRLGSSLPSPSKISFDSNSVSNLRQRLGSVINTNITENTSQNNMQNINTDSALNSRLNPLNYVNPQQEYNQSFNRELNLNLPDKFSKIKMITPIKTKNLQVYSRVNYTHCSKCLNRLPNCSVCRKPLGTPKVESVNDKNNTLNEETAQNSIDDWFVWCQNCGHGGHYHHIKDWFASMSVCPALGCDCMCNFSSQ
ncbi:hypothetical protein BB561_003477 [Smittium simulii]|uniref:GATOR2 complex protein MIO zinc-ribbon like domain-containing protein n=1 Tax=Smittium simulii TaxID=133385 RepID=A0A2T9YL66_9FUNG|nr:hypothetical protein BB561_003477 [Smittium simulii]